MGGRREVVRKAEVAVWSSQLDTHSMYSLAIGYKCAEWVFGGLSIESLRHSAHARRRSNLGLPLLLSSSLNPFCSPRYLPTACLVSV